MVSYKYAEESFTPSVSFETDNSFGDVEIFGNLMQFKEIRKSFWMSIGIGGSVAGQINCDGGIAYFGACDKNFYAVDIKTGKELWRFSAGDAILNGCCIHGDVLFFGSNDQNLYALKKDTGELVWKFHTNAKVTVLPSVYGGVVYLGSPDGNVYAIDAESGSLRWKFSTNGRTDTPLVADGKIFTGFNNLYALDMDGNLVWSIRRSVEFAAWIIAYENKTLFLGGHDSNFLAIDSDTGRIKWKFAANDVAYPGCVGGNKVFFGSRDNCIYALNKINGSLVWKFRTGGFAFTPVFFNGMICTSSYDNSVYALDAETGRLLWRFKTDGFVTYVKEFRGRLFFGSWDCHVYCLDIETGELIWKFKTSMSSPAKIEAPDASQTKSIEVKWSPDEEGTETNHNMEPGQSDYGEFSGTYIQKDKSDYVSSRKKGYIK